VQYVEKATREAKVHTSWIAPNDTYDDGVRSFVEAILGDEVFVAELESFVAPLVEPGYANSLAMQAIKLTAPGVPDIYQGTELWDLSLVDPDNRRPVDFDERRRALVEGTHPKVRLTQAALAARPDGEYQPLRASGDGARHVLAFTRGGRVATTLTPSEAEPDVLVGMNDAKPSLTQRALAVIVLAVVAVVALRLAIGAITAVFWIVALVVLVIATLWAVGTLRGLRSGGREKPVERSSAPAVPAASHEDRVEAQMREIRQQLKDQGRL